MQQQDRAARNVDHLRWKRKKAGAFGFLLSRGTLKEETHLQPATCSAFSLLLQVLSRPSPACPSCAVSFKTLHAHYFPSQLSPTLFKYQSYHPPLHDPFPLSIIQRSPFRPLSSRVSQKKVSAAAKACSRRAQDFNVMSSMRTWIVCVTVGVIWYSYKAALVL